MLKSRAESSQVLHNVLLFTLKLWAERKGRVIAVALTLMLATLAEVIVPVYAGRLIDALSHGRDAAHIVVKSFLVMTLLGLAVMVLRHLASKASIPITISVMRKVAQGAFHRVQRFSTDWHNSSFAGSNVRKITRGMWAVVIINNVLLLALLPAFVVMIGTILLMGNRWPVMGFVMALGTVAYVVIAIILATRIVAPASRLSNAQDTRMGGVLADALSGNAVVKSFGAEAREDARLGRVVDKWSRRTHRTWMLHTWSDTGQLALLWAIRSAATAIALSLWWKGHATPGEITYVLTTYFVLYGYLREIGQHVHHLQRALNEMEETVQLHTEPMELADSPRARPLSIESGEVHFDHVTFCYSGQHKPLYRDLNVRIAPGERIGLVGHSGSGKTTFVKLIQRLHDVTEGRLLIDGQDVAHATQESLRSQIAIVQQEPILFHRSLAENIAYAWPTATLDDIERAARLANAHDFIMRMPRRYQTSVGERGVKLSGGERQRIALARAFLANAPILILDEATSSLDSESEALIQQAIDRLMSGRTSIVIAHRLSTVRAMDRILVFEHGRIVEEGNHEALLRRPQGHYRRLFERQSAGTVDSPHRARVHVPQDVSARGETG